MGFGSIFRGIWVFLFILFAGAPAFSHECYRILSQRKSSVAYPHIANVYQLRLPARPPLPPVQHTRLSAGLVDDILELGRKHGVVPDFKLLSDATPRRLTSDEQQLMSGDTFHLATFIERFYEFGDESVAAGQEWIGTFKRIKTGVAEIDNAFLYTEQTLQDLVRIANPRPNGSLLHLPYPYLVPAGRFQEAYYWDTYFGVLGLIATGRIELAQMQAENLLSLVRRYGLVPNGTRDYYLSRSQPPMLSSLVRMIYEQTNDREKQNWLRERAFPLMVLEYENFWMRPERYDSSTGLNHHWDDVGNARPRPERHSFDNESHLGLSYLDVRSAAEAGTDFTDAHEGEASQIAGVLLNSLLYKTERDLEWAALELDHESEARKFAKAAEKRQYAINRHLWNEPKGRYENYNLRAGRRVPVLTADTFVPLFVELASEAQANRIRDQLKQLEENGGLMSSELIHSPHQWDGYNGWAPHQVMAIQGLANYGYRQDARRLAQKWINALTKIHSETGAMFERIDVKHVTPPVLTKDKYPVQKGFLWTNASFQWALKQVFRASGLER